MSMKQFNVGDKVRIQPVWDGLPREGTGVVMYVTPPGESTPEHIAVAAFGDVYRPSVCTPVRYARYFVRRDNPRDKDNPYLITISTLPLELIDVIAPGHNPDQLTVEQVGDGWWLPEWEILEKLHGPLKAKAQLHYFNDYGVWNSLADNTGMCWPSVTYRTRLTREELLALIASKKRLIRVEELPAMCWISYGEKSRQFLVTFLNPVRQEIACRGEFPCKLSHYAEKCCKWSSDLKTWHSFEVEDTK